MKPSEFSVQLAYDKFSFDWLGLTLNQNPLVGGGWIVWMRTTDPAQNETFEFGRPKEKVGSVTRMQKMLADRLSSRKFRVEFFDALFKGVFQWQTS